MEKSDGEVVYSDEFPEFFKIYLPAICSQIMRIPPDFIEKFGGEIPAAVTLRRPGMMTWQVDVKKIDEHLFLEKGWPQFVKDNSVEDGDFMTFSYAGNSMFFVKIFARNGCRKRLHTIDGQSINNHQLSQSPQVNKKLNEVLIRRSRSPENRIKECKNPCFSQILLTSYFKKGFMGFEDIAKHELVRMQNIPMKFWRGCIGKHVKGSTMVTFWVKNKSWVVGLSDVGDRYLFTKGWLQFVKDNSLRPGNECTFELIDTTDLVFKVLYFKHRQILGGPRIT
ncbi:hypothetical protein CASFOL_032109 [Castilleja foliolosa]|uniref:TF-B3 domain-containing protein n=1 Tax=Castilleja foliolosa TaxID=1961234 RepID=A0ABD3C0I5_9LAMI